MFGGFVCQVRAGICGSEGEEERRSFLSTSRLTFCDFSEVG